MQHFLLLFLFRRASTFHRKTKGNVYNSTNTVLPLFVYVFVKMLSCGLLSIFSSGHKAFKKHCGRTKKPASFFREAEDLNKPLMSKSSACLYPYKVRQSIPKRNIKSTKSNPYKMALWKQLGKVVEKLYFL